MNVESILISQINVGERRRKDMGDIAALAKGIERVGLLEPIVVDRNGNDGYRLVAGERRLRAAQMLKWREIPANLRSRLSNAELREIELEENENRKPLTEAERSIRFGKAKKLVENAKKAAEVISVQSTEKDPRGRKATYDAPKDEVAESLGISSRTLVKAEQQVQMAERYPFMQGNVWKQSDVLRVRERLEEFGSDKEREQVMAVIGTAKILDPELTVMLVDNLRAKKPAEREEIFRLSQSSDPRERSMALTKAANKPPMPDPRLGILDNALHYLNAAIKPFPDDPLTPQLAAVRDEVKKIRSAVKEVSYDAQRERQRGAIQ